MRIRGEWPKPMIETFSHYRDFIKAALDSERFGRGSRAQLADHLGVQNSFISLVLNGKQDFSLEHGMRIADFMGLKDDDREILLLMIQRDRSSSPDLTKQFQKMIDRWAEKRSEIINRVKRESKALSEVELSEYYSDWRHSAIHMAIRIEELKDASKISERLGIDAKKVRSSLEVLERLGFIERGKGGWNTRQQSFHVGERSPALRSQHTNWRLEAVRSLGNERSKDLHYTAVMSIDAVCAQKIREAILKVLESCDPDIKNAKDEEIHALTIDLFKVG